MNPEQKLQRRYPVHRNGEVVYVLVDHLSPEELHANIDRLRSKANNRHADTLQAYINTKFSQQER